MMTKGGAAVMMIGHLAIRLGVSRTAIEATWLFRIQLYTSDPLLRIQYPMRLYDNGRLHLRSARVRWESISAFNVPETSLP